MGWRRPGTPPLANERGFTLVELVMAMSVVSVALFGTMQVFLGSLQAATANDARTTAVAIATREVEQMRAAPYANVGFLSTASGYVATITEGADTFDTVTVDSASSEPTGADETHKGIVFHIRRDIVWMSTSYAAHSWKRLIATITWSDKYGTHTARQDAGVYPGGLGPADAATTTSTTAAANPSAPATLTATVNATNPYDHIDLAWTAGAVAPTYWEVNQSADGGINWVVLTTNQPAGSLTYPATGLSSATSYEFRVRGVSGAATSSWTSATATTQTPPPTCTVGAASIAPNPDKKKSNNALQNDLVVTVNTSGECANFYVYYPVAPTTSHLMTKSGTTYTQTLDKNAYTTWSTGNKTATVKDASGNVMASIAFVIN